VQPKGVDVLDDAKRTALREQLLGEAARLGAIVDQIDRHERESLSEASGENVYRDHMADQGSATFERELDMTLEENERTGLEEIRSALARMDADTYGVCTTCGAEIPAARLEAVPSASLCMTCKQAEETR
jgi:RNA polymerase-binding protein DksA